MHAVLRSSYLDEDWIKSIFVGRFRQRSAGISDVVGIPLMKPCQEIRSSPRSPMALHAYLTSFRTAYQFVSSLHIAAALLLQTQRCAYRAAFVWRYFKSSSTPSIDCGHCCCTSLACPPSLCSLSTTWPESSPLRCSAVFNAAHHSNDLAGLLDPLLHRRHDFVALLLC